MTKHRLYHLALDWEIDSHEMMTALATVNAPYRSHFAEVGIDEIPTVRALLESAGVFGEPEPAPVPEPVEDIPTETPVAVEEPIEDKSEPTPTPVQAGTAGAAAKPAPTAAAKTRARAKPATPPARVDPAAAEAREAKGAARSSRKDTKREKAPATPTTDNSRAANRNTRGSRAAPPKRSATGDAQLFEPEINKVDDNTGIHVIRKTTHGAMQRATGRGSAGRRRMQTQRQRDRWKGRRGGRGGRGRRVPKVRPSEVSIRMPITLKELSAATAIKVNDLIGELMRNGIMVSQNAAVPAEAIQIISHKFLVDIQERENFDPEQDLIEIENQTDNIDDEDLEPRHPVVTVMGHVDHGKTTLLDYIRQTKSPVAGKEAGGITQHVGAYLASHNDRTITFIDTPGHAAFTQMRIRGAKITDIVILVIAADDGFNEQTKEALSHARAAEVEIVVAITKVDKDNADVEKVYQQLTENLLHPVKWGGQTEVIECSGITGQGIDDLLETLITVSDLHEYRANPEGPAFGHVLEARKTPGRGIVTSLLVADGTLRRGDPIICGTARGRVRSLFDHAGKSMKSAGPSVPVEVLGFNDPPIPGDKFYALDDEEKIKDLTNRREVKKQKAFAASVETPTDSDDIWRQMDSQDRKLLSIIIRADVQGSLEVLRSEIPSLANDEVEIKISHAGIGSINESDIFLAQAQEAIVLGFNVGIDSKASALAREYGVDVETYKVIYELMGYLRDRVEDALDPEIKEVMLGDLIVRQTFKASRIGVVAGCYVDTGVVRRGVRARLMRDSIVIWEGEIESVRRFKEDVEEVREGFECGVKFKNFNDIQIEDLIEVFEIQKIKRTLDEAND